MASSKSLEPILRPLLRSSRPHRSRYICAPCLHNQQQQQQIATRTQQRHASSTTAATTTGQVTRQTRSVPDPTPFVPNVETFLKLIGRDLSSQSSKIPSWNSLFTSSSEQLKDFGIEPARTRRYLLRWREKFRNGIYGPGGDFQFVKDGVAHLKIVELPSLTKSNNNTKANKDTAEYASTSHTPGTVKLVLNVPANSDTYVLAPSQKSPKDLKKPVGFKIRNQRAIAGPFAVPLKGSHGAAATVSVAEGMWEDRRGKKVYGGERRRAEVLHKLGVAEHRKAIGTAR